MLSDPTSKTSLEPSSEALARQPPRSLPSSGAREAATALETSSEGRLIEARMVYL